jgi:alpha-tubulin suppressor-like RCC1 family protein
MKEIIQIGAGDNHTILLDIHGKVYVTGMYKDMDSGKWRDIGSRDAPIKGTHKFPIVVGGFGGKVSVIDAGNSWNAALSEDGFLYTWGMGNSGQLARSKSMGANKIKGKYIDSTGKNNEYEDLDLTKLYMGEIIVTKEKDRNGNDILLDDGKPKTYDAYNYFHKKIRNTFLNPQKVEWAGGILGLKIEVLNFSCGDIHLLAVARAPGTFQSRVFSSGCSSFGQLGHGGTKNLHELTPIEALDDKNICKVAAGNSHSLALSIDGKNIYSWGKIDAGALGLYDEKKTLEYDATSFLGTPKQVAFPDTLGETPLVDISCGTYDYYVESSRFLVVCFP